MSSFTAVTEAKSNQPQATHTPAVTNHERLPHSLDVSSSLSTGTGQSLDNSTRSTMESHFHTDFSRVRVHTSGVPAARARSLGARAFAIGQDIAFSPGMYAPQSTAGRQLLS